MKTVGFDGKIKADDLDSESKATKLENIAKWAQQKGMATGEKPLEF